MLSGDVRKRNGQGLVGMTGMKGNAGDVERRVRIGRQGSIKRIYENVDGQSEYLVPSASVGRTRRNS